VIAPGALPRSGGELDGVSALDDISVLRDIKIDSQKPDLQS
jgi:hypothetical protein